MISFAKYIFLAAMASLPSAAGLSLYDTLMARTKTEWVCPAPCNWSNASDVFWCQNPNRLPNGTKCGNPKPDQSVVTPGRLPYDYSNIGQRIEMNHGAELKQMQEEIDAAHTNEMWAIIMTRDFSPLWMEALVCSNLGAAEKLEITKILTKQAVYDYTLYTDTHWARDLLKDKVLTPEDKLDQVKCMEELLEIIPTDFPLPLYFALLGTKTWRVSSNLDASQKLEMTKMLLKHNYHEKYLTDVIQHLLKSTDLTAEDKLEQFTWL